jgi:hypothetical protein
VTHMDEDAVRPRLAENGTEAAWNPPAPFESDVRVCSTHREAVIRAPRSRHALTRLLMIAASVQRHEQTCARTPNFSASGTLHLGEPRRNRQLALVVGRAFHIVHPKPMPKPRITTNTNMGLRTT